jgi:hypothetical protein
VEKSGHDAVTRRLLTGTRIVFIAATVGALVFGYVGLRAWIEGPHDVVYGRGLWDIAYYDLQLFVLSSDPLQTPGPYPITLQIARFAAPAASIYAVFEAARALFAGEYRRWRNRVRRGHAIVVGDTTVARALADQLARAGKDGKNRQVHTIVEFSPDALRAAGIAGAAEVYACADDDVDSTVNVAIAQVAATARRKRYRRPTLKVYAQVSSATLALGLRARWLGQADREKLDVDFFNVDELAARASVRPGDFQVGAGREPHILIAGLDTFGRAVLVAYAQLWPLLSGRPHDRVKVTVVGATQSQIDELVTQWACIQNVCDVHRVPGDIDEALTSTGSALPHRTYICYEDENQALFAALTVARLWRGGPDSVVVRLNRLARHDAFARSSHLNLLDDVDGRLRLVSVTKEACQPDVIAQDLVERLAQSIHHRYLLEQVTKGEGAPALLTPWAELADEFREANRAAARDIGRKLSKIHATVAPRTGFNDEFSFTPAEEEELAVHEHERWCAQRTRAGWRYGAQRDNAKKLHPSLVDWSRLSEAERAKDREAVRDLTAVLADVGLEIVRLSVSVPAQVSLSPQVSVPEQASKPVAPSEPVTASS